MAKTNHSLKIQPQQKKKIVLLLGLIAVALFFAIKLGVSDIYGYQAKRIVLRWETTGKINHPKEAEQALSYIKTASWLEPNFPDYAETEAQIYIWQYYQPSHDTNKKQATKRLTQALNLYKHSLKNQPSWPYAWLGVVNTKVLLQEFDNELSHAIERTITLGGYEAQIQQNLISITFPELHKFDALSRKRVLALYDKALQGSVAINELIKHGEEKRIFILYCLKPDLKIYARQVQQRCSQLIPKSK